MICIDKKSDNAGRRKKLDIGVVHTERKEGRGEISAVEIMWNIEIAAS